ncbi:MAG: HAD family phosphatase [Chlamydiae bacterium]|jgi:HAD superfamily hydrolase (TIGR01509 family)|nr:HAD family phosphatase [Chlamydiota bacterium]
MPRPSQPIKAIIFDCDGTLVDSEYAHYQSWQYAVQNQGGDLSLEEYYFYVGNSAELNAKLLAEKIGSDRSDKIEKDKREHYRRLQNLGLPSIEPTIAFINRLAKEKEKLDFKLAVASALGKEEIVSSLKQLGIENLFDIVLSGSDDLSSYNDPEGVNKPKPYIYLHAAKELNTTTDQCVVIEDSSSGVTAGVAAGCFTIAVPNPYTFHQDLSHAHVRIPSFADMSVETFLQMVAMNKSSSKVQRNKS